MTSPIPPALSCVTGASPSPSPSWPSRRSRSHRARGRTRGTYQAIQCYERSAPGRRRRSRTSSPRYRRAPTARARASGSRTTPAHRAPRGGRFGAWTITAPRGTAIVRVAAAGQRRRRRTGHVPQVHVGLEGRRRRAILDGVRGDLHTVDWEGDGGRHCTGRLACLSRDDCGDGRDAHIHMRRIALTLRDVAPPTVTAGGTLLEPGSRRGDQALEVEAADAGSGVRSVTVELNGDPLESRVLDCRLEGRRRAPPAPCPGNATPQFQVVRPRDHVRALPPGPEPSCGSAPPTSRPAATANHTCETRTVRIDNLCPVSDVRGSALRARFKGAGGRHSHPQRPPPPSPAASPTPAARRPPAPRSASPPASTRDRAHPSASSPPPPPMRRGPLPARAPGRPEPRGPHRPLAERRRARRAPPDAPLAGDPAPAPAPARDLSNGERVRFDVRLPGPASARAESRSRRAPGTAGSGSRAAARRRAGAGSGRYRFHATTGTRRYAFRAAVPPQTGLPVQQPRASRAIRQQRPSSG